MPRYNLYGSFPEQGDPNIDPQNAIVLMKVLIIGTPQQGTSDFEKPPYLL